MMKKMLRRQGIVLLICLLTTSLLVGCKVMDDQQREDRLKELLRDKYGEEFEVRDMYVTGRVEAWCFPVNNQDLVFKIDTPLEMEYISMDDYLQTIVERQISDELQEFGDDAFGECYISANITLASTNDISNKDASTVDLYQINEYVKSKGFTNYIDIYVFFDGTSNNYENEYEFLQKVAENYSEFNDEENIVIVLYSADDIFRKEAEEIIGYYGWHSIGMLSQNDIYKILDGKKKLVIYHNCDGNMYTYDDNQEQCLLNFEKYCSLRKKL